MHIYSFNLWNLYSSDVDNFYVAWCKVKCCIMWKLINNDHNSIILNSPSNIHIILEKRFIKCISSALNGNIICQQFYEQWCSGSGAIPPVPIFQGGAPLQFLFLVNFAYILQKLTFTSIITYSYAVICIKSCISYVKCNALYVTEIFSS